MTKTKAKKLAWAEFSKYIRLRDALRTTQTMTDVLCVSCGARKPAFGKGCAQAGHFIPGRHNSILFDEKIVQAQCYHCNIGLKGNWVAYEIKMIQMYGANTVSRLKAKKTKTVQYKVQDYLDIRDKYKMKFKELEALAFRQGLKHSPSFKGGKRKGV